ncbi:MAG: AraC family transcriptional regulator ligand-binding domain-containing protein, partial [Gemmatimonadales bacterium]
MSALLEWSHSQTAKPEILAAAASGVESAIRVSGTRPARVFELAGVDPARVSDPDLRLDLVDYCRLMETAANETGDGLFGARFGGSFTAVNFKAVGALVVSSVHLGDGLRALARSYSWIQENCRLELTLDQGRASLGYQIYDGRILDRQQDAELTIAAFCALIRHAVGHAWRPREVHFEHGPGASRREYQRVFGTSVFFDQPTNAVVLEARSLSTPMARPDSDAFDRAARFLQRQLAAGSAAAAGSDRRAREAELGVLSYVIESQCRTGDVSIGAVAGRMGVTVYRLRRRLKAFQAPFDELVSAVRRRLAIRYVEQTDRSMTEI